MEKKNLFVIGSPLQLLNTLEAVEFFKLKNVVLVVIYNKMLNNINQINAELEKINCDEIIKIDTTSKEGKFFKYVKAIKYLKKYDYDKLFVGDFGSIYRIFIANLKKDKVFLLDDGTLTIEVYERDIKPNNLNKYSFKELRFLFFGFKIKIKDKINLFTYFDFEPLEGMEVVRNRLKYMRKDFVQNNIDYSDTVFFLGQPTSMFLYKDEYITTLENISNKYKDKKILYIPHRAERIELKDIIKSKIKNIEILEINQPVEKYFLSNGIYPKHVIAYVSTALTTTKILFEDCLVEYNRVKDLVLRYSQTEILYKYFDKDNILEIDIDQS